MSFFQNPVAADVSRLEHSGSQSELTFTATVLKEPQLRLRCLSFSLVVLFSLLAGGAPAQVRHVVVVGVDGLSPDGLMHADTPNLKRLQSQGAWTWRARAVMPTSSGPNWASMIMGAGPEQHGVTSNDWRPDKYDIAPTVRGAGGIFPTIFSVLREQMPGATLGVFHDWSGYGHLFERQAVDVIEDTAGPTNTIQRAVAFLQRRKPTLTFIHLDHVDGAGHKYGHGTPEYYAAVAIADALVGEVMGAIAEAGIKDHTLLLVTSDHGGKGKGHGGATMAEIEIPWLVVGPGVRAGYEIQSPVNTYDTAATIAFALKVQAPEAWIARPVREAFVGDIK